MRKIAACLIVAWVAGAVQADVRWQHPGGIVTDESIAEARDKTQKHAWAREVYQRRKASLDRWLAVPSDRLRQVFPRKRGNVYHNFSCPRDRVPLTFDPFKPERFECPVCHKSFDPLTDAGVYPPGDHYHATMYGGWVCMFFLAAGEAARDLGIIGRLENDPRCLDRGIEILMLHAEALPGIETWRDQDPVHNTILTYSREGDAKVLYDLACAYEVLREKMTADQRSRFEKAVIQRMLDDVMLEPEYRFNNNNTYQWHRCIVQCAVALERADLIDWSLGFGAFDPQHRPEHMSLRRLAAAHFKPDGAFWEMCSGYHLYPLHPFCELAVIGHNLSVMDPKRFEPERYDMTRPANEVGTTIRNALTWFLSMSMPDRTMPTIGDSMAPRAGMTDYYATAEIGYRYFDVREIGDYESLRQGRRDWWALLYGADEIVQKPVPFTSSFLSSGWVSLRSEWQGNKVWAGLNGLIPGGGHQHADRLNLLLYSQGKLLALEKATPYNESTTRELGTLSFSHNTVTVDKTSQKQGESLKGDEIPSVAFFHSGPVVKYAEVHGDHIYPQAKVYRRSVAVVEDIVVDCFRVNGGSIHDWMVHHAGSAPQLSIPTQEAPFDPASWLANGGQHPRRGRSDGTWTAQWSVDDVHSRLTMLGAAGTEVDALETYPVDNAVIVPGHPACQTLCVRRHDDAPFLAVWDAWKTKPNLQRAEKAAGADGLTLESSRNRYRLMFGPGKAQFADGVTLAGDAAFVIVRADDAATMIAGTSVEFTSPAGTIRVQADRKVTASIQYADGLLTVATSNDLQYDTFGGRDHDRPPPPAKVSVESTSWHIAKRIDRSTGGR